MTRSMANEAHRNLDLAVAIHITKLPGAGWYRKASLLNDGPPGYVKVTGPQDTLVEYGPAYDFNVPEGQPPREVQTPHTLEPNRYYVVHGEVKEDGTITGDLRVRVVPYYSTDWNQTWEMLEHLRRADLLREVEARLPHGLSGSDPDRVCKVALEVVAKAHEREARRRIAERLGPLIPAIEDIADGRQWGGGKEMMLNATLLLEAMAEDRPALSRPADPSAEKRALDYIAQRLNIAPNMEGWVTPAMVSDAVNELAGEAARATRILAGIRQLSRDSGDFKLHLHYTLEALRAGDTDLAVKGLTNVISRLDEYEAAVTRPSDGYGEG